MRKKYNVYFQVARACITVSARNSMEATDMARELVERPRLCHDCSNQVEVCNPIMTQVEECAKTPEESWLADFIARCTSNEHDPSLLADELRKRLK